MKKTVFKCKGYTFRLENYSYSPGSPGQYSGPPERCYPPEPPELEGGDIFIQSVDEKRWDKLPDTMVSFIYERDDFFESMLEAVEEEVRKEDREYEPRDSDNLD